MLSSNSYFFVLLFDFPSFESSSQNNNGSEFIVSTKTQKINVLGTKFNIKAYSEDDIITTTLVEGKVKVGNGKNQILLSPNQQSKVDSNSPDIGVSEVDVSQQISWINGLFSFNGGRRREWS